MRMVINAALQWTLHDISAEQSFAYDAGLQLFDCPDEVVITGRVYKADSSGSANVCASYGHVVIKPSAVNVFLRR